LAESPLKARLSEKLGIAKMEIDLLARRMSSQDIGQSYRLEDLFDSVRTSLNLVQKDLLETMHSTLGPQIPELVPEIIEEPPQEGMNEQILAASASIPPPPSPLPAAEEPPKPIPLVVSPAGAEETPFQIWQKTLDVRQIQALEFLRGFEREGLWEKIRTNRIIMHESAKLSGRPIDQVLLAIADLMECRVRGLSRLLSGLAEKCAVEGEEGIAETWGGIHEVIRLERLAKVKSSAGPLTEVSKVMRGVKYYPEEFKGGRFTAAGSRERQKDVELDGWRGQTRIGVEVKSSEFPITFNNRSGQAAEWELRFRNQAREFRALIRSGKMAGKEYHFTAPKVDPEVLYYLKRTIRDNNNIVRVRVFFYTLLNEWEGLEQVVPGLDEPPSRVAEENGPEAAPVKANHREWNEGAWVWALAKYTGEGGLFKGFNDDPLNLHKIVRQPQTSKVISGLQESLDEIISIAQQEKARARGPKEIDRAGRKIAKAQSLKRTVAEWRKRLNTNSLSTSTICGFSLVLAEIREFLEA